MFFLSAKWQGPRQLQFFSCSRLGCWAACGVVQVAQCPKFIHIPFLCQGAGLIRCCVSAMRPVPVTTFPRCKTKIADAEELLPQCDSMRAKVSSAAILVFTTILKVRSYRSSESLSQKSCQSNNVLHTTKTTYTNKYWGRSCNTGRMKYHHQ